MLRVLAICLTVTVTVTGLTTVTARAQSDETLADIRQELSVLYVEIQKLKRELSTTGAPSAAAGSDSVLDRVTAIESALQTLTSKTEELDHRIQRIVEDGTNRIGDLEFRLVELEGGDISQLGETTTLGGDQTPPASAPVVEAPAPVPGTELAVNEKADFDAANLALGEGAYRKAADLYSAFRATYPGSPLLPEALLGRGKALEALGDTREAARSYLDSFSTNASSSVAPEALYELGAALGALGQLDQACVTLAEVRNRYPDASAVLDAEKGNRVAGVFLIRSPTDIAARIETFFGASPPEKIGVAVSGGGDSVALLHVVSRVLAGRGTDIYAATVDHGLRPDSASEAEFVADLAATWGIPHTTLTWSTWNGCGNLQDKARRARQQLLSEWAKERGIATVALGHTADDQAETVLMRMARSSGVTGLSAIRARTTRNGLTFCRPLLEVTRADLRSYLTGQDVPWIEDPSNDDTRFERVKARKILSHLEPLGISAQGLSEIADQMNQAREALDWYCFLAAQELVRIDTGHLVIDLRGFRTLPTEIARRLVLRSITWLNGAIYPPRRAALTRFVEAMRKGDSMTTGGIHGFRSGDEIWICREFQAVSGLSEPLSAIWDRRWRAIGRLCDRAELRALGPKGLEQCPDWRRTGRPRASLISTPGVWKGEELVAAPTAGMASDWTVELCDGGESFFASILSH